jgi:hypothetical protein
MRGPENVLLLWFYWTKEHEEHYELSVAENNLVIVQIEKAS